MIQTLNIDSPWSAIDCAVQAELLAAASPPPRQEGGFLLSLSILLALSFALNSFTGSALRTLYLIYPNSAKKEKKKVKFRATLMETPTH